MNQENPFEFRQEKKPKIAKVYPADIRLEPGVFEIVDNKLNQYYLDQIRKSNYSRFKTLKEAGISVKESVDIVFKQINTLTNAVYEDYIQSTYDPANAKTLEEKIKIREDILGVYRQIEDIKKEDMRELATNKAIALLELRNLQDEMKAQKAAEKAEQDRIKAEQEAALEAERKAKEKAKLEKLKQIEKAKKILELAEKERKERAIREKEKAKQKALEKKEKEKQAALEAKARERQRAIEEQKKAKEAEQALREQARIELEARLAKHREEERLLIEAAKRELEERLAKQKQQKKPKTTTKKTEENTASDSDKSSAKE